MEWGEGLFKILVEHSEDIHVATDRELRIRYISSSVARFTGVEPVTIIGRSVLEFVEAGKHDQWKRLLHGGDALMDELALQTPHHGIRYFQVHASPLLDTQQLQGLVLTLNDVTSNKLREEELVRSNRQLDQVIYKTTHDLRAPVRSALGLVKLAESVSLREKDEYIALIKKSLLKLDLFLEEMNNFYRYEKMAVQRETINLRALLEEEIENLRSLDPHGVVRIDLEVTADAALLSDRVRVKTIVTNILSNAIKYMDLQKQNPFVKIAARISDAYCDLDFEDNGIGIEAKFRERIFEQFFRATDRSQGTGLGLFIVKDTIERLKGTIGVTSEEGKGTMFRIRIPNQLHAPLAVS